MCLKPRKKEGGREVKREGGRVRGRKEGGGRVRGRREGGGSVRGRNSRGEGGREGE